MSSSPRRCSRCQRPLSRCLCPLIPSLPQPCPVLILQHSSEASHALNTARLAHLGLQETELWVGESFESLPMRLAQAHRPVLLFPGPDAVQAGLPVAAGLWSACSNAYSERTSARHKSALNMQTGSPDLIVVPDGTWRKARRILMVNPILQALPRWVLPPGPPSRYRLRKAPDPQAVSTLEAIARVLQILAPQQDFSPLLRPFEHLIDEQIQAMGPQTYLRNYPTAT
ncbi:MAG TPA: tRNA-uridine aminocarboxypropyltransferase [Alcaligenes sp.]|nr:tRNA-uridine aminocarboxypropyltransferase [Alcaligenes sp.]HRL27054.1 tRNA-uridine aminocarboxypropyltransferase [Alcaligenes sp.]